MKQVDKKTAIVHSALWAAYADALGFISELTDEQGLQRRLYGEHLDGTRPWKRRIGGAYGAFVDLPAGCYSDDTQLRLATMRAIHGTGEFDAEVFAKVELPVWLAYDLGAGPTTKAAAVALVNRTNNWFSNFFQKAGFKKNLNYVDGGGNGAAMRIQPHVWAATSLFRSESYLRDVIRNSICTHGHPRAIFGAVFHALCLAYVLERRAIPHPDIWLRLVDEARSIVDLVHSDPQLATFWVPTWQKQAGGSFAEACEDTFKEMVHDVDEVIETLQKRGPEGYEAVLSVLDARSPRWRGTGTRTAVAALALCWHFKGDEIEDALLYCARALGTDTDTIATLAGAMLGALQSRGPKNAVQDRDYIADEAARLADIADGVIQRSFRYPDLTEWKASKSSLDVVGLAGHQPALAGLGHLDFSGETYKPGGKGPQVWQWATVDIGTSVLCSRRARLKPLPKGNVPVDQKGVVEDRSGREPTMAIPIASKRNIILEDETGDMFGRRIERPMAVAVRPTVDAGPLSIDDLSDDAIKSGFQSEVIGEHLRQIFQQSGSTELAAAYAAILAKAWRVRQKRKERDDKPVRK